MSEIFGAPEVSVDIKKRVGGVDIATQVYNRYIIAQSNNAPYNKPIRVGSIGDAVTKFGYHSEALAMVNSAFNVDSSNPIYVVPVDGSSSTYSTATIEFTTAPTEQGIIDIWIDGISYNISVTSSDTIITIATKLNDKINENNYALFSSEVDGTTASKLTLTATVSGEAGSNIKIIENFKGAYPTPAGVDLVITDFSSVSGNIDISDALDNIKDITTIGMNMILSAYSDSITLPLYNDLVSSLYEPQKLTDICVTLCSNKTYSDLITLCESINQNKIIVFENLDVFKNYSEHIATASSVISSNSSSDSATGYVEVIVPNLYYINFFSKEEKDTLLKSGVTTFIYDGNNLCFQDLKTTNSIIDDIPDGTFSRGEDIFALSYIKYTFALNQRALQNTKIALSGDIVSGEKSIDIDEYKKKMLNIYKALVKSEIASNYAGFKDSLTTTLASNKNGFNNVGDTQTIKGIKFQDTELNYYI